MPNDPEFPNDASRLSAEQELRQIRRLLIGIFLILLAVAVFFAKDVLLPLVLALIIFLTLSPVSRWLNSLGVPLPGAAFLLIGGLTSIGVVAGLLLAMPVSELLDKAPQLQSEVRWKLSGLMNSMQAVSDATKQVEEIAEGSVDGNVQKVVLDQPGLLTTAMSSFASAGSSVIAALVLSFFLLAAGDMFLRKSVEVIPRLKDKKRMFRMVRDIELQISRYLASITAINAGLGLAIGVAMMLVGMPYPFLWGLAAFALNFLPFVGAVIGVIMAAAVSIVTYDSLYVAILPPLIYFILTSIEGQFVTPTLVGRRLELNTVAVFVTVIFWIWMWGAMGALLAVPFLVFLKVVCDNVDTLKTFGHFLGSSPSETQKVETASVT